MTIYRPKNSPYYHFDYQYRSVRYHGSTNCVSKRDAEQFERDHRREVATGRKEKPSVTIDEGAGIYWQDRGQFEKNASTTEYQIGNVLRLIGGTTLVQDIDDLTVARMVSIRRGERAFPKRRKKKGSPPPRLVSAATVNREVELLKRILNFLAPRYRVGEVEWKRHKLKEPKERVREASPQEEASIFAALREKEPDLCDLVEFALISGARRTAITTLLWSKVDQRRGTASVHTKGDEWHTFPLTQRMREIIANRPKAGPFVFTYVCERPSPARGDRPRRLKGERYPFSKEGWYRKWYRALAEAGVTDFRFHDLRHTAATRIARTNGIQVAQRLLGHTRIETTTRYAHTSDDDLLAAMENVEQSRNSPEQGDNGMPENRRNTHLRRVK
ncbi:site-specific integrase [Novosphingobium sp. YJ-S2-02]|uniref:Site-specific integrase n=1 Tax=Novosphingobium aureum TaxID=2792964 RepID=A0A931ML67_9SPHN|nr:site-specific integrase [Novosphingobium aureum]MBH0112751.1 site-specific integrase [Novosphingobium aureum]